MVTSSSAIADEPARRAASRQTANFYNSHVTVTTPIYGVICRPFGNVRYSLFDDSSFSHSWRML